jgi:hypothetical protein
MVYHLTRRPNRSRVSRCRMRSTRATAVHGAPGVVTGRNVPRRRCGRGTKRKFGFKTWGWHRPTVGVVFVVREVDAAVIPRVAVATSGFEAGKRCLGSIAGGMLEQGSRRVSILASVEDRRKGRHAAWLAESVEHAARFIITKVRASRRIRVLHCRFGSLQELGLEERQRVLKGVRLGTRKGPADSVSVQAMHDEVVEQEVNSVFQPTSIVPGEQEVKSLNLLFLSVNRLSLGILKLSFDDMLSSELLDNISLEFGRAEVFAELGGARES